MGRKPVDQRLRAQAVERLRRGEPARAIARELNISATSVRNWARGARPSVPAPARAAAPALPVSTVHDQPPPAVREPIELDGDAYAQAAAAAALEEDAAPQPASAGEPGAPGATTPPETVVDLFEGAVSLCIRLVVVGRGGEWTHELEHACRFTASERGRLLATAPYVAEYVGNALRSSPYVGIALFGMSALEVITTRLALVKRSAPGRGRLAHTAPPAAATKAPEPELEVEEDIEPLPASASPGVAAVAWKATLRD